MGINPNHARTVAPLLKRLKGKSYSPNTYKQKVFKIGNGGALSILGRNWPRNSSVVCNHIMLGSLRRVFNAEMSAEIDM